ncbi:MAG: HEAT repeat domain-containing protein [Gemmataceae bacterium]
MTRRTLVVIALGLIVSFAQGDDTRVPDLVRGLKAEKARDRMQAASDLARLGEEAKPALTPLLDAAEKDADAKVRAYALYAVKQLGDHARPALPRVLGILKTEKSGEVRCIAADTLGRFGADAKDAVPRTGRRAEGPGGRLPMQGQALGKIAADAKAAVPALAEAAAGGGDPLACAQGAWARSVLPAVPR